MMKRRSFFALIGAALAIPATVFRAAIPKPKTQPPQEVLIFGCRNRLFMVTMSSGATTSPLDVKVSAYGRGFDQLGGPPIDT